MLSELTGADASNAQHRGDVNDAGQPNDAQTLGGLTSHYFTGGRADGLLVCAVICALWYYKA
jgi:hypothetical protein